jgi:8-oxo-dGTP pyrophosphatase MutT (NUDIX family)
LTFDAARRGIGPRRPPAIDEAGHAPSFLNEEAGTAAESTLLDRLRAAFAAPEPSRPARLPGFSGVLVPVFPSGGAIELLYERRADDLRAHPGEVAFPGGRVEPSDPGPRYAALREAHEEVGIDPSRVHVVGHLTDYRTYRGNHIAAYVGIVRGPAPERATSREVADVFRVPVADLLDPANYEARALPGPEHLVHYFRVKPRTVWGITGHLTAEFLRRYENWVPPASPKILDSPEGYLP